MKRQAEGLILWPGVLWLLVFFAVPLGIIAVISFTRRDMVGLIRWEFTLDNYLRLLEPIYWVGPLGNSVGLAVLTTLVCVVLGYPLAYIIARSPTRQKHLLIFLVVLPSFTNFLVRIYAWFILLRPEGWLSWGLQLLGVEANLLGTWVGVLIGLVYGYLPFMVLPVYATLERLDSALIEAAYDLGATQWQVFRRVIFPLSRPGIIAGAVLVFLPVLGEFLTPKLLGGGKVPTIGVLIEEKFLGRVPDWPFGAAIALTVIALALLGVSRHFHAVRESRWVG